MNGARKKPGESGFALLLVFLMAAVIAITLYMQIPRVAFQAQRQKEQLLIERGEQYKRAIQMFVRTNNRYPGDIKDLENFNNRRFLRQRFPDPMTGKDDWRIVHVVNGVFTDSVLNKKKPTDPNQPAASTAGQYVGEQAPIGGFPTPGQQNVNPAVTRRRPSDGGAPAPQVGPDGQPIYPSQPFPGQPVPGEPAPDQAPPAPGQAGNPPISVVQPYPGTIQGQPFPAGQPLPGQQPFPGQTQGFPGAQPNPNQVQAQPFPGMQPNPGAPVPPELANQPGAVNPLGQQIPGRLPGFVPGAQQQPNTNQAPSPSSSYVGGNQPYVGSSGPYVGGGAYIGSSPTSAPTNPNPAQFPGMPGQVNPQPIPGQSNLPGVTGAPFTPGLPQNTNPGQNPGATMINNILMNPRPIPTGQGIQPAGGTQAGGTPSGGPQSLGQSIGAPLGGQVFGGGIAGVASKSENAAIMVYNDRTNYNEWEFLFDVTRQAPLPNLNAGGIGTPAANLGGSPGSPLANPSPTAAIGVNPGTAPGSSTVGASPISGLNPGPGANPTSGANPGTTPGQAIGMAPALPPTIRMGRP
jgi:hypothetical protein